MALIEGSGEGWRCVAVTPSYSSFLALAEGRPVDWTTKTEGALPDVDRLLKAAATLLGGRPLSVVTVDMPLSTEPVTGRRAADAAISRAYGGRGAAVHSPSVERSGLPLALVIDERGHIEGLVTLTDVLEALVGEVPDADQPTEETIVRREDGSWLVDGLLAARELEARLGLGGSSRDVEEEADYQTMGGMVMDALGRVPVAGDRFEHEGYAFEVLDMDGRRVDKVLVAPIGGTDAEGAI